MRATFIHPYVYNIQIVTMPNLVQSYIGCFSVDTVKKPLNIVGKQPETRIQQQMLALGTTFTIVCDIEGSNEVLNELQYATVQLADSYAVVTITVDINVNVKDLVAEVKVVM